MLTAMRAGTFVDYRTSGERDGKCISRGCSPPAGRRCCAVGDGALSLNRASARPTFLRWVVEGVGGVFRDHAGQGVAAGDPLVRGAKHRAAVPQLLIMGLRC